MATTQRLSIGERHHPLMSPVETGRIVEEFRTLLLGSSAGTPIRRREKRLKQRHKDVQKRTNKAPETVVEFMVEAANRGASTSRVIQGCQFLVDYFKAKAQRVRANWNEASLRETREEGELNNLQSAIDLGDHSTPTLARTVEEIDKCVDALEGLKGATLSELHARIAS